jgi:hypothetical protein
MHHKRIYDLNLLKVEPSIGFRRAAQPTARRGSPSNFELARPNLLRPHLVTITRMACLHGCGPHAAAAGPAEGGQRWAEQRNPSRFPGVF